MTPRNAFLFPGQGSYLPGLFANLADHYPLIGTNLSTVDEVAAGLGREPVSSMLLDPAAPSLQELVEHDPAALLLAIFTASVTAFQLLVEECGVPPDILVGHSLGDFTALTAAGAFTLADGAYLVAQRDESLRRSTVPRGGMVALDCGIRRARDLLGALDEWQLSVAADNGPDQVVVSGPDDQLARLREVAAALGLTATRLRIPYPFHNRVLLDAADDFSERAAGVPKHAPRLPVYSSLLGRYVEDVTDVERMIATHLVMPVRFLDAVRTVHADGARRFVESGPKSVLVDLVSKIVPGVLTVAPLRARTDPRTLLSEVEELATPRRNGWTSTRHWEPAPRPEPVPATVPEPVPAQRTVHSRRNGSGDRDAVFDTVRAMYAELLGYPPEAMEPDADLESDLGIDSIKQTEAFARVLDHFGIEVSESTLRMVDYPTMTAIVDLVLELREGRKPVGSNA